MPKITFPRIFLLILSYFLFFNGYPDVYAQRKHQDVRSEILLVFP